MSLSIVFGTPTTDSVMPRRSASSAIRCAPRRVPSPPMTNSTLTPSRSSVATIAAGSWPPREVPRMVPPRLWMSATTSWLSRSGSQPSTRPRKPSRKPSTCGHAVVVRQLEHQAADHVVEPGAEAAAGHDRRPGERRVEVDVLARAARLHRRQLADRALVGDGRAHRVVEQHPVGFVDVVRRARPAAQQADHRGAAGRLADAPDPQVGRVDGQRISGTHNGPHCALACRFRVAAE